MNKKAVVFILKTVVSASLIGFLLFSVDWKTVASSLKRADILLLIIALLLNLIERFELTYKWNMLIKIRNITVKFGRLFWINSIGSFLGLFLPSSIGTDVVRGYYLVRNNSEKSVSISSVFVDRVLGLFSLLLLGVVAVFFAGDLISKYNVKFYIIALFVLSCVTFYLFQRKEAAAFLNKLLGVLKHKTIVENAVKLHASILEYKKYPKTLILSFIVTLLVQVTRVLTYYFVALAFDIHISLVYYFLFIPIIMIIIMIPISIGGLGLKEGTFVAFFTLAGMSINDAVIISFLNSILDMLNTLIFGGMGYLFFKSGTENNKSFSNKANLINSNE